MAFHFCSLSQVKRSEKNKYGGPELLKLYNYQLMKLKCVPFVIQFKDGSERETPEELGRNAPMQKCTDMAAHNQMRERLEFYHRHPLPSSHTLFC